MRTILIAALLLLTATPALAESTNTEPATSAPSPAFPLVCHLVGLQGNAPPTADRTFIVDESQSQVDGLPATFSPYEIHVSYTVAGGHGKGSFDYEVVINRLAGTAVIISAQLGPLLQGSCVPGGRPQF